MTRGRALRYLLLALVLFVAGVCLLAVREHFSSELVEALVVVDLLVVTLLVRAGWRLR